MRRKGISCLLGLYLVVFFIFFFGIGTAHGSGIFEVVTPHSGSDLENCVALLKQRCEGCGPWNEDLMFVTETEAARYRASWGGCGDSQCPSGSFIIENCLYQRYVAARVAYQEFQLGFSPPCHKIGQNIRMLYVSGNWDPVEYDVTVTYLPDTYMVTDKNAGSCGSTCDAMVPD